MFKKIFNLLEAQDKFKMAIIFFFVFLGFVFELVTLSSLPIFISTLINSESVYLKINNIFEIKIFINLNHEDLVKFFGIFLIIGFFVKNLFFLIFLIIQSKFLENLKKELSKKIFSHYLNIPYNHHLDKNPSQITRTITNEVQGVYGYIENLCTLIKEISALAVILIILIYVNPLVVLIIVPFFLFITVLYFKLIKPFLKKSATRNQNLVANIIQTINETFGAIKDIKILSKEKKISDFFNKNINEFEKNYFYFYIINKLPKIILELLLLFLIVIVCLVYFNIDSSFDVLFSKLALFSILAIRFIPAFNGITTSLSYLKIFDASVKLISKELDEITKVKVDNFYKVSLIQPNNIDLIKKTENYISVKNLSFNYKNNKGYTLKGLNFEVAEGSKIALTGKTGSGKSTLFNLMLGLLKPDSGDILFKNKSIFADLEKWKKEICYISQNIYLLDNTIKNNITFNMFNDHIDEKKLKKAIEISDLESTINSMSEGIDTMVGNDGLKLSGGERQRVAIARALYRDANIFFMDEFTSALDAETEKKIVQKLLEIFQDKTMFMISHRQSTLENCDGVLKLKNGELTSNEKI